MMYLVDLAGYSRGKLHYRRNDESHTVCGKPIRSGSLQMSYPPQGPEWRIVCKTCIKTEGVTK